MDRDVQARLSDQLGNRRLWDVVRWWHGGVAAILMAVALAGAFVLVGAELDNKSVTIAELEGLAIVATCEGSSPAQTMMDARGAAGALTGDLSPDQRHMVMGFLLDRAQGGGCERFHNIDRDREIVGLPKSDFGPEVLTLE